MIPDYKKIYSDLIEEKYPEKMNECIKILKKKNFGVLDVISIHNILSEGSKKDVDIFNQYHRAYDEKTVKIYLQYQVDHKLSNNQLSKHFKITRNSIARWKKQFPEYD
ncbi:helix-turn-helix domain-containing protein [Chryseobacterium caseinilyticum]|uniref:Helix-turn-helix domain-containing protein n=1 Tax=Chryseobacterium caseinilyticum TaxID=2771428 RepID=A0ABR8ZCR4_9FLAO|nr:helix-turn-helix domain-containing protein [Chryseobacterium caseinilyticum]MBD8082859.1 helix-turn-helix domain-containing protein [Chryseobacterium caseinilyticum]